MWNENKKTINTIRQVMPAVVSIVLSKSLDELKKEMSARPGPASAKNKFNALQIPLDKIDAHGMVQVGGGSGFIEIGRAHV